MGYYITNLKDKGLNEYIGSNTIYSCASNGAFDSEIDKELEQFYQDDDNIYAVVDESGIDHFLNTLKNGDVIGRDVGLLIEIVIKKYKNGFTIRG